MIIMVIILQKGEVTVFKMGPQAFGKILYPVHAFFIDGLLIDTGSRTAHRHIKNIWKNYPIHAIINTHWHEDHIGNNDYLQNTRNLPIYAHEADIPKITNAKDQKYWLYERLSWGIPKGSRVLPLSSKFQTDNYTFEIIHTPGHTPGHICLYEPENKILFSGDLFFGTRITYLRNFETFGEQLDALKKILNYDFTTLFCSFRGIIDDPKPKIRKKIAFMENLRQKVLELAEQGLSENQIQKKVLGRENYMYYMSSGDFSKKHDISRILHENSLNKN
ncbi:MBL fold metallo-hydrolase [Candidatus Harpocratesius sp.]